jgi:hypothetical protein
MKNSIAFTSVFLYNDLVPTPIGKHAKFTTTHIRTAAGH